MEMYSARPKLLFVDDEEAIRQTLPVILSANGFEVTTVATVAEAIREINRQPFEILLSDLNIGQPSDGFTVVSAMRRVQPDARTYILTGYPDFTSALEAIRRQVDDYLIKPADIPALLKALRSTPDRVRTLDSPGKRASTVIRESSALIIEKWVEETEQQQLKQLYLSKDARIDHLPALLRQLANRLDQDLEFDDKQEIESATAHGKTRRQQAYSIPLIVEETCILNRVIADTVQRNLAEMDISFIIPDLILISDNLYKMMAESLRAFLSVEPIGV
jgi:ActR/RegA family two-component response regulator